MNVNGSSEKVMALHGKEKIWYIFNRLIDARELLR